MNILIRPPKIVAADATFSIRALDENTATACLVTPAISSQGITSVGQNVSLFSDDPNAAKECCLRVRVKEVVLPSQGIGSVITPLLQVGSGAHG